VAASWRVDAPKQAKGYPFVCKAQMVQTALVGAACDDVD
jgi:hypothetical protein